MALNCSYGRPLSDRTPEDSKQLKAVINLDSVKLTLLISSSISQHLWKGLASSVRQTLALPNVQLLPWRVSTGYSPTGGSRLKLNEFNSLTKGVWLFCNRNRVFRSSPLFHLNFSKTKLNGMFTKLNGMSTKLNGMFTNTQQCRTPVNLICKCVA